MKYFIYVIFLSVSFVSSGFCVERLFLGYVVGEGTIGELKYVTSLVEMELLAVGGLSVMRPYDFGEREFVKFGGMGMEELGVASRSRWLVSGRSRIVGGGGEHEVVLSLHDVPGGGRVGQVEVRYGDIDEFREKLHKSAYQFRCIMFDRDCVEASDLVEEVEDECEPDYYEAINEHADVEGGLEKKAVQINDKFEFEFNEADLQTNDLINKEDSSEDKWLFVYCLLFILYRLFRYWVRLYI